MSHLNEWMDRKLYPNHQDNWDNKLFRECILRHLRPEFHVLDIGAGRGALEEMDFKGQARNVAGVDPDPAVHENPYLNEAQTISVEDGRIPYPDEEFDLIFSNNVLEHVADPSIYFSEVARLLKPGGVFLAKTPNLVHYVATISRFTPHAFHEWVGEIRKRARKDTFPTVYNCNTGKRFFQYANHANLIVSELRLVEGRPEYLRFSTPTYLLGYIYERVVNRWALFSRFRCVIFAELQKPE